MKKLFVLAGMGAAVLAAAPSAAAVTTFASFNAATTDNIVWQNNGTGGSTSTYRANGTGGKLFTYVAPMGGGAFNPNTATPGAVDVTFKFLQPQLAGFVNNVGAKFTMDLSVTNAPATQMTLFNQPFIAQWGLSGSFSFVSKDVITIGSKTFAAGSNLLTATFINDQTIFGQNQATSGGISAATSSGATINYTSDFLDFSNTVNRDASFALSAITSLVSNQNRGLNQANSGTALRSFRATATGNFSSDPAPIITAIPEPATWAMMLGGFGLIGGIARRTRRVQQVLA
jgi:hypothetical protein